MYLDTQHETIESVYMVTVKYRDLDTYACARMDDKPYRILTTHTTLFRATTAAMAMAHALVKYAENYNTDVVSTSVTTVELVTC